MRDEERIWRPILVTDDVEGKVKNKIPGKRCGSKFLNYMNIFRPCLGLWPKKLSLILRRSRTGTVWFYTSTSNKRAARPKLYTESLTRDLKRMYIRLTLVRISIKL